MGNIITSAIQAILKMFLVDLAYIAKVKNSFIE